ncbi:Endo-1,4-beta-xylanase A precursor [Neorhodopirellula pilleata]|uniref:Beta-xylanase n=2 Tax=Neorhodopirellula pilleata TaxID=2714738 RepID=A0A5C6AW65_9BACT|nr:Endo-1,4-beta-xylanase A precursor [Neorhodopirellula pilleata]
MLAVMASSFFWTGSLLGQDPLAHRKSNLTIVVQDGNGNAISDATIDLKMTKHAFQFGTQVHDRLFTIAESDFGSLNNNQKRGLIGDFSGTSIVPTWQDTLNYRAAISDNFNHIIPTNGMQWLPYQNNGPQHVDAAIHEAQANGMTVTGHAVVWQKTDWPTPNQFRPAANPDPQVFHDTLVAERLGPAGIVTRFSDAGAGPTVLDWDVLNEPLHVTHYSDVFVDAGIYPTEKHAWADYFIRADGLRPDANLAINDYNILSSGGDNAAMQYRDLVNDLLVLGAPIDQIKVQAHMDRTVSKAALTRRLDILAETGLPIAISEFDMRDDANQISPANQKQLFQDILEASFEHESVNGFSMWGFWDPAHWRGNGPLFDEDWIVKDEASAWFDLVRGEWMTGFEDQAIGVDGIWNGDAIDGTYDFTVNVNGQSQVFSGFALTDNSTFTLTVSAVPEPSCVVALSIVAIAAVGRRRRKPTRVGAIEVKR